MNEYFSNMYICYYYGSLIKCGKDWCDKNVTCTYSKAYYILDGECEIEIEGIKHRGEKGIFYLIPPGVKHSFYHINDNYIKKYWIHFNIEVGGENFFDMIKTPYSFNIGINKTIIKLYKDILKYANNNSLSGMLKLKAAILDLVAEYISLTNSNEIIYSSENSLNTSKVIKYINSNLNTAISVNELAQILHLHPNYFIRFFKKQTGMSPMKYVNRLRMERAKSMLENTDLTIVKIMEEIGFDDISHFSNYFKQYTGYSPKKFRKMYK